MNIDHRNPRLRRGFAFVALAAVLGLSAVGLTQCRMVDDTVTGVDVRSDAAYKGRGGHGRSRCVHQCNDAFKRCVKNEESRHKAELKRCKRLKNHKDRKACEKAEWKRHWENLKQCVRQMQICKRNCRYREGAGSAGR